ncbi:MAG: fatty acid desaturase [Melioribacteraceae bacterium]|nr:fatty acid desaturase [Melioribacteraceae bacterium]
MGILIALTIIALWFLHLVYSLNYPFISPDNPMLYFHILLQAYLYTGLFITGHDAMHRIVSSNYRINKLIGQTASYLYAGLSYKRLVKNHFLHHKFPGTDKDPDFTVRSNNFFIWYATFMYRYATFLQIVIMAVVFNLLKIWFDEINIWLFWVIPAFLSSLQLFYFGTYLPHRKPHEDSMEPHKARTQKKNHLWAMLSCYFFGYHYEHHDSVNIPWWQLYKKK